MTQDISITRTKDEPGTTTLAVEAPSSRVEAAERRVAAQYAKRVRLPGFRKGKVPLPVIRQRFGDALREAVLQELVQESWKLAVDQEALEPLGEPQVRSLKFDADAPLTFEFLVEVKPQLTLDRISGFTVERRVAPVTDDQVEDQLDELRRQRAPWVPLDDVQPKPGHLVRVSITTDPDADPAEAKPYDIVLGSDQALPGVEDAIMALRPGQSGTASITFPEDHPDESRRGQTMTATIVLREVKEQQLPDLTDDFAREVGDFDSADALRTAVRADLESSATRDADAEVRRQLLEQIVAANEVPAPAPLVERLLEAYRAAYQIPDDQRERFVQEFGPIAENQVRRDLILDHLADTRDLGASEDDLDARIEEIAARRDTEPGKVYASLQKENRLREVERSLTEEKVFGFLLDQSTITEIS